MEKPALYAKVMVANIVVYLSVFIIADLAGAYHASIEEIRTLQIGPEAYFFEVKLVLIVVFFFQVIFVPFEFLEKKQAPSKIFVNDTLYFSENML
jgi:hypothetical protein